MLTANAMRKAGMGRLTHQYNPTKSGGAATIGEWMRAVGSIIPHKGAQYAGENYGLVAAMPVHDAVAMIRATPAHRRSEFAQQIHRRRGNPMPGNAAFSAVKGRNWIQEWYETGDPTLKVRARDLRRLGYRASVSSMGEQVTQYGRVKSSLLDIRPGTSGDQDLECVPNPGAPGSAFKRCVKSVTRKRISL